MVRRSSRDLELTPYDRMRLMLLVQFIAVMLGGFWLWGTQVNGVQWRAFRSDIEAKDNVIRRRIALVENQLRGVRALYSASQQVDPNELVQFINGSSHEVKGDENSRTFIGTWFWIGAEDNVLEPSVTIDRASAFSTISDVDRIRSMLNDIYKHGQVSQFTVSIASLNANMRTVEGTPLPIVQPVLQNKGRAGAPRALRGFLVAVVDLAKIARTTKGSQDAIFLNSSIFSSRFDTVTVTDADETPMVARKSRTTKPLVASADITLANGKLALQWQAHYPHQTLTLTPLRGFILAAVMGLTMLGCQMTFKLERLHKSLIKERDRSQSAVHEKSRFLANMSHEIRTPLNAIVGMSDLLRKGPLIDKQQRYLDQLHWSVDALMKLVDGILEFSKLEAKQVSVDAIPTDMRRFFTHIADTVRPSLQKKGVNFLVHLDDSLPDCAVVDGLRVQQICLNILTNATKFTSAGHVSFVVHTVMPIKSGEDSAAAQPVWLEIVIRDTGIGLAQDRIAKIFERFSQADNSTTRLYGGTGLGLAIVRELTDLLKGHLDVESEIGKGTKFVIRLPILEASADDIAALKKNSNAILTPLIDDVNTAPVVSNKSLNILVAEDDRVNRMYMRELLSGMGHKPIFAHDGNQAFEHASSKPFDLIFMDCQMPHCDGYSATQKIRALPDGSCGRDTVIIALTAHALAGEREKCMASGMNDFMTKPVREPDLMAVIARWVASSAKMSPTVDAELPPTRSEHQAGDMPERLHLPSERLAAEADPSSFNGSDEERLDPVVDLIKLSELRATMGGSFDEMMSCFIEDLNSYAQTLSSSVAEQKYSDARRVAHTLKSTSLLVGASSLSEQAKVLEAMLAQFDGAAAADAPQLQDALGKISGVRSTMNRVVIELNTQKAARAA